MRRLPAAIPLLLRSDKSNQSKVAMLGLLALLAGSIACPDTSERSGGSARSYKDVTAERGPFRIVVSASGLVRPINRIELKSKASGVVVELPIDVGESVPKGSLIAKLDQVEERTALAQAEADLDIARAELDLAQKNSERSKQLLSGKVISQEARDRTELELAVAKGKLVQATTALERAHERMADTVISAPVDGVILQKYVESGQIIASGVSDVGGGTPIADIADMRRVYVEAGIDEIDIGKIREGQKATIRAEAYPDTNYRGEVVRIAPEATPEQAVTVFDVVVVVENRDDNLKSGMNASLEIVIVDQPDALTIPAAAIQGPSGNGVTADASEKVVLVRDGGDYREREITTGRTNFRRIEVLEGLEEGDVLGVPMASRLKEEQDRVDERIKRNTQSFGSPKKDKKAPSPRG